MCSEHFSADMFEKGWEYEQTWNMCSEHFSADMFEKGYSLIYKIYLSKIPTVVTDYVRLLCQLSTFHLGYSTKITPWNEVFLRLCPQSISYPGVMF